MAELRSRSASHQYCRASNTARGSYRLSIDVTHLKSLMHAHGAGLIFGGSAKIRPTVNMLLNWRRRSFARAGSTRWDSDAWSCRIPSYPRTR